MTLVCLSRGGNPLATITWYKNGERVDSSYTTVLNGSKNTYEFTAAEEDNNAVYTCQAKNDLILAPLETSLTTIVQCKIDQTANSVSLKPIVILIFGQTVRVMCGYRGPLRRSQGTTWTSSAPPPTPTPRWRCGGWWTAAPCRWAEYGYRPNKSHHFVGTAQPKKGLLWMSLKTVF